MRLNKLLRFLVISSFVFIAYSAVSAQDKPAVNETKEPEKKVKLVVTDNLQKPAEQAKQTAASAPKETTKTFGSHALVVTENITPAANGNAPTPEGGRYYTVTTWDGSKWVSKQVLFPPKKATPKVQ